MAPTEADCTVSLLPGFEAFKSLIIGQAHANQSWYNVVLGAYESLERVS